MVVLKDEKNLEKKEYTKDSSCKKWFCPNCGWMTHSSEVQICKPSPFCCPLCGRAMQFLNENETRRMANQ